MSDYQALLHFNKQSVSKDMIVYLASTTSSIIRVKSSFNSKIPSLTSFIHGLVKYSNVQTPTLMATCVYLAKLRNIIPSNTHGIETTQHRLFLGCLILAAKTLNDSSPLNKHWTKYTNGLLELIEVNTIERELIEYFSWDVIITTEELIACLSPFLHPIKEKLMGVTQNRQPSFKSHLSYHSLQKHMEPKTESKAHSVSNMSIPSLASSATISTSNSMRSTSSLNNNIYNMDETTSVAQQSKENNITQAKEEKEEEIYYFRNPERLPFGSKNMNATQNIHTKKTRPIILKESFKSNSVRKFNLHKSSWQSIFN